MQTKLTLEEVVEALRQTAPSSQSTDSWTLAVLGGLRALCDQKGLCVDPASPGAQTGRWSTRGEWLWDLVASTFPRYESGYDLAYYDRALSAATSIEWALVVESEWGDAGDARANAVAVLEDFAKLLAARATIKVMVFGFHERDPDGVSSWENLRGRLEKMRALAGDDAPMVLFGVGWNKGARGGPVVIGEADRAEAGGQP